MHTRPVRDYVLERTRAYLKSESDIDFAATDLDYNLFTGRVSANSLRLTSLTTENSEPFLEAERLRVNLGVRDLFGGIVHIQDAVIDGLSLNVVVDEQGRSNLPGGQTGQAAPAEPTPLPAFLIESLAVNDGAATYADRSRNLAAQLPRWTANVSGNSLTFNHELKFQALAPGSVSFEGRTVPIETLHLAGAFDTNDLTIETFELRTNLLQLAVSGTVEDFQSPNLQLKANGSADAAAAMRFLDVEQDLAGNVQAEVTVSGGLDDLTVAGTVRSADMRYGELRDMELDAAGTWNATREALELEKLAVRSPAGQLDAQGEIATAENAGASRVEASFSRLNLEILSRLFDAPVQLASNASVTATASWPGLDWSAATGDAEVELIARRVEPAENLLPVGASLTINAQPNRVQVSARSLQALDSQLAGNVTVVNQQQIAGQVNGEVADLKMFLGRLGMFLGQPGDGPLRAADVAGSMTLTANLTGSVEQTRVSAAIDGRDLAVGELTGGQATVQADYSADRIVLQQATVLWKEQTIAAQGTIGLQGNSPALDLTVNLDQVSLPSILAAAGQHAPVEGTLNMNAVVQGTVDAPQASADLVVSELVAYQEPWGSLTAHAQWQDQTIAVTNLELQKLNAQGEAGLLRASGTYATETEEYTLQADGQQLEIRNLTLPDGTIVRGLFNANFQGKGTVEQPGIEGKLEAQQLQIGERSLGDLSSSLALNDGTARLNANLPRYNLAADAEIRTAAPYASQIQLTADQTDLSQLEIEASGDTLSGSVSATVEASGEIDNWRQGSLTARVSSLQVGFGERSVTNDGDLVIRYADEVFSVDRSTLHMDGSRITADGSLPLEASAPAGKVTIDSDLNLDTLASMVPSEEPLAAQGQLALHASLEGTLTNLTPQFEATLSQAAFFTPAMVSPLMGVDAAVRLRDGALHLDEMKASWAGANISAGGQVPLGFLSTAELPFNLPQSQEPLSFRFDLTGLVINSFSDLPRDTDGTVSIHAELEAPRLEVEAIRGEVRLDDLRLSYKSFELTQQRPATLLIENGRAAVDHFLLTGPDTEVSAKGGMDLTGEQAIDLQLTTKTDLGILTLATDDITAAGAAELQLAVRGTVAEPVFDGGLQLRDGQLAVPDPQFQATDMDAVVRFQSGTISIESLSGNLNGGTLKGSGTVTHAGAEIQNVNVDLSADNVFADIPEGLRTLSNAKIQLRSAENLINVGGQVQILEGSFNNDIELNRFLFEYVRSSSVPSFVTDPDPLLSRLRYGVDVETVDPLVVDNNVAELAADLDVRLVGTYYRPSLTGRVDLQEGGTLYIGENRYFIDRGTIDFFNEARIEPVLDIVARTQAQRRYDIELRIAGGGAEEISSTLTSSSHPDLAEPDLISLLLTGRTREELRGEEVNAAAEQSLSYLTGAVGSRLTRGAAESLGLSEVRIEPNLIAAESDPGARLTIGQDITADLGLIYSMNLADSGDQIWIAQYDVTRRFTTQATKQEDNTYRFDLRHDLRFGGAPDSGRLPTDARPKKSIGTIDFLGATAFEPKVLTGELKVKPGKPYDFFTVRRGVDRLENFFAGQDFLQANIDARRDEHEDRVDLTVQIEQGPKVEFIFEGWSVPNETRDRVREVWRKGVFDAQRVNESMDAIREALVKRDYLQAKVDHIISTPEENLKRVVFEIQLGTRFHDVELEFDGAAAFNQSELQKQLRNAELLTAIYTAPEKVIDFLGQLYRSEGYLNAKIDRPASRLDAGSATGRVVIPIQEGPQFHIAGLTFDGNEAIAVESLREAVVIPEDRVYRSEFLQDALIQIEEHYWRQGYNDVVVTFQPRRDDANAAVTIATKIDENQKQVVSSVSIEGTHDTSENMVLTQLGLAPGDTLNFEQVSKARRNLYRTGAYSLVDIRSSPLDQEADAGVRPVGVQVKVREVRPFQIRYGAFFDTERGPGFIADFTNRNTLGAARVIGLRTRYDSDIHEARLYFSQPFMRRWPLQSTVASFARRELEAGFITDRIGISFIQETRWKEKWVLNYGYRFEKTHTFEQEADPLFPFDVTIHVAPLNTTLSRETRDDLLDATRGSFVSSAFEYAPAALGSDLRFVRYFGQFYKYIALGEPRSIPFQGNVRKPRLV
ncbi:MAG: translocation/assembly module TamB domain-containing protein, partial [Bryobacterales bacterium]